MLTTASTPGAIAIIQLLGDTEPVLEALTGRGDWPVGRLRLAPFGDVDEGLAGRIDDKTAQVMPHGGPRVVQRLLALLAEIGADVRASEAATWDACYPEARDPLTARMLAALARARSPLAIDLLLDQPRRWRAESSLSAADEARSQRLRRLIDPPRVVLVGTPNVGKSTLSNALLGRSMSIALDAPGTTRDYTTGLIDLAGLVVHWHDTPGLRETDDRIEAKAIDLARRLIAEADLVVSLTDAATDWPALPREPDLQVGSKADVARRADADLCVSARTGEGLADMAAAVRDALVPTEDLADPGPWRFDEER